MHLHLVNGYSELYKIESILEIPDFTFAMLPDIQFFMILLVTGFLNASLSMLCNILKTSLLKVYLIYGKN